MRRGSATPLVLPLGLRNRLAELILDAFDDAGARATLDTLAAFCRERGVRLGAEADARLAALAWFERAPDGALRLLGAHRAHQAALCRRAAAAAAMFRDCAATPDATTVAGLLARGARLADRGLYFEVHELLEPAWMRAEGAERVALQALIQVAVAFHHAQNDNREGAISLLTEGLGKLSTMGHALPLETEAWQASLHEFLAALREGRALPPVPPWPNPTESAWRSS